MSQRSLSHTYFLFPLLPSVRGLRSAFPLPVGCREDAEVRTLRRNTGNPLKRAGLQVGETGLLRMSNTSPPAAFRDVIQSARAPRVRTSGQAVPEVWAPAAPPLPARQKPARPVCVGTGRDGSARKKAGSGKLIGCRCPHVASRRVSKSGKPEKGTQRKNTLGFVSGKMRFLLQMKLISRQATRFAECPHL